MANGWAFLVVPGRAGIVAAGVAVFLVFLVLVAAAFVASAAALLLALVAATLLAFTGLVLFVHHIGGAGRRRGMRALYRPHEEELRRVVSSGFADAGETGPAIEYYAQRAVGRHRADVASEAEALARKAAALSPLATLGLYYVGIQLFPTDWLLVLVLLVGLLLPLPFLAAWLKVRLVAKRERAAAERVEAELRQAVLHRAETATGPSGWAAGSTISSPWSQHP